MFLKSIVQNSDAYGNFNVCLIIIYFFLNKHEFSNTSKIQISDSKKTCRDLVLSDLICYTCYVCCLSKNQKKTEVNKIDQKTGEMIFTKKNNKYGTSSHLRQGLYTFFWSQKLKIMMHIEIYNVCEIITFFF